MQKKKVGGFTLIELMVVVAIIAILAVLGVTSFSSAMKRARNATRQSDIAAVAKALEVCYDVSTSKYTGFTTSSWGSLINNLTGNNCLASAINPDVANFEYSVASYAGTNPNGFLLCAKMEKVGNAGSGNNSGKTTLSSCSGDTATCEYFCVVNQQ